MGAGDHIASGLRDEIVTRKAEREAAHKRAELLMIAAHVAGGMMASPLAAKAPMQGIADAAVTIARLIRDGVDANPSGLTVPDLTKITPVRMPVPGGGE